MADLTFRRLQADITALARDVTRYAEGIYADTQKIDEEAREVARIAEHIQSMGVDSATTSETRELAQAMTGLASDSRAVGSAGVGTARAAMVAHEQAVASHGGINEAISRSTVDVTNLNREWLRQE
ncbi:hypothetical protein [Streptomyces sp. NBC_01422]|uniref:hypothetical protein n=1 Tax=Streptomyces sp. NBC_01422 TaxID=2903859 RepID=UPI002E2E563D|nr:hypothetical protein [Streptomyces sp. NBC_01422]